MIFKSTNEALAHALIMTEAERDHIEHHYSQIIIGLKDLRSKLTPEKQRERVQYFINASCHAQFLREAVEEFDRLQDEDRINSLKLEMVE